MIKEQFEQLYKNSKDGKVCDYELLEFVENNIRSSTSSIPHLFRYSMADYYNIRNLETGVLRLSPIGKMNDIFEGLSCQIDDGEGKQSHKVYSDGAYIKSFSEENDNLLMWAHYADQYSGMCVEYDFSKLSQELLYHLFPVYYSSQRFTEVLSKYVAEDLASLQETVRNNDLPQEEYSFVNDIMHVFLVKPECWSYEKEWRIVATFSHIHFCYEDLCDAECEEFFGIQQELSIKNCIKAVYLGPRMKSEIKAHVFEICQKLGEVPVYNMELSKTKYKLVAERYVPDTQ